MTPQKFIEKWRAADLKERTASHSHFNDLWGDDWRDGKLTEDEILARLFKLNQERAKAEAKAAKAKATPKGKKNGK